jgi:hypothetical protein
MPPTNQKKTKKVGRPRRQPTELSGNFSKHVDSCDTMIFLEPQPDMAPPRPKPRPTKAGSGASQKAVPLLDSSLPKHALEVEFDSEDIEAGKALLSLYRGMGDDIEFPAEENLTTQLDDEERELTDKAPEKVTQLEALESDAEEEEEASDDESHISGEFLCYLAS